MSWTEERIATLAKMWESGMTASQIAEELGGISRNAVIGKAHRLGLQSRPSPVRSNDASKAAAAAPKPAPVEPAPVVEVAPPAPKPAPEPKPVPEPKPAPVVAAEPVATKPAAPKPPVEDDPFTPLPVSADDADEEDEEEAEDDAPAAPKQRDMPVMRSVGPGGFLRQNPGEQTAPLTPAPPRRLVPARPSDAIAGKTTLLDLNDRICKWPIGHPGEPDFHFCGDKVNPGFPYCVAHCGHAYQAQLPRRDRRPPPPLPYGGPRVR
ncbi:GcrA cell cycle regulator [Sphingomonas sp. Leaf24]|uniref:GcrA family cell cycle regulator n=1 Tax=unclassified Sphingomonas TaxID=196159 RepID=UPI00070044F5|nr:MULTISPECIES: GcrA family cell cycle regulator [unclassified Sphingomonas]KQM18136.1 GcrA cell cycle regulator [Sphingomonas sp. Leaf5]KQM89117.1 GcrA cell cycle regulator [Sphingomonas sp. Leaf24]